MEFSVPFLEFARKCFGQTFHMVISPDQRIYWPFLLSSLVISVIFFKIHEENPKKNLKFFFSKKCFFHSSSFLDIKILLLNIVLKIFVFPFFLVSSFSITMFIVKTFNVIFPYTSGFVIEPFWKSLWGTVLGFMVNDLFRFVHHLLFHHIPILKRAHRTHHSAPVLTPLTVYRTHPIEMFTAQLRNALITGVTLALYYLLFSGRVSVIDFLGVNIAGFLFNVLGSNLRHSPVPIGFGILEYLFISPRMHQIHHSKDKRHLNKNYGTSLAIWDQILGSFYRPKDNEMGTIKYGLAIKNAQHIAC